jgi:hypothetical protein
MICNLHPPASPISHPALEYPILHPASLPTISNLQPSTSTNNERLSRQPATTMEELDEVLLARHVDLDSDEPRQSRYRRESVELNEGREQFTESMLRGDVVTPHVVHFAQTYNAQKKYRRFALLIVTLALSLLGLFHFRKVVLSLSHEATLDIETKMDTISHPDNTANPGDNSTASSASPP